VKHPAASPSQTNTLKKEPKPSPNRATGKNYRLHKGGGLYRRHKIARNVSTRTQKEKQERLSPKKRGLDPDVTKKKTTKQEYNHLQTIRIVKGIKGAKTKTKRTDKYLKGKKKSGERGKPTKYEKKYPWERHSEKTEGELGLWESNKIFFRNVRQKSGSKKKRGGNKHASEIGKRGKTRKGHQRNSIADGTRR